MKALSTLIFLLFFTLVAQSSGLQNAFPIKKELNNPATFKHLNYPKSVKRFYAAENYRASWITGVLPTDQVFDAMLLLDCVSQYGLDYTDYHPEKLTYDNLHDIIKHKAGLTDQQKARFDIILTDALITLINQLHYGKFNPRFTADVVDKRQSGDFKSENILSQAKKSKHFADELLDVQPHFKAYIDLQHYMRLIKGQNAGDCYEIPETEIKKIGMNMERLRWANVDAETYVLVNIPSYELLFQQSDSTYLFQIIIGKPTAKTPTLQSQITSFTVAPDPLISQRKFINKLLPRLLIDPNYFNEHNITIYNTEPSFVQVNPQLLKDIKNNPKNYLARQSSGQELSMGTFTFQFRSPTSISLFDPAAQVQINKGKRAVTNGSIGVIKAKALATLILRNEKSENQIPEMEESAKVYHNKKYKLKTPIPIAIIYLTTLMQDGLPVYFKDIYNLDSALEKAMYLNKTNIKTNIY